MNFAVLKKFIQQGPLTINVKGACMHEVVPAGSDVRLEENSLYWPGEIVAFKCGNGELVSHRFLGYLRGRSGWLVITRADSALRADSPVALRNVLGRITHVDGHPFRPRFADRVWAQLAWFPAIARSVVTGLRKSAVAVNER